MQFLALLVHPRALLVLLLCWLGVYEGARWLCCMLGAASAALHAGVGCVSLHVLC
jgi:hypothetical protein